MITFTPPKTAFLGSFAIHKKQSSVWCSHYPSKDNNGFFEAFKTQECFDIAYQSILISLVFMSRKANELEYWHLQTHPELATKSEHLYLKQLINIPS